MAYAENDVVIQRDAMSVYTFLLDPVNLPLWREGVRSVELIAGAGGSQGAVYRPHLDHTGHRQSAADFELTVTRPGAEIQFQVLAGPVRPHGGYYLSSEGTSTRVRFALQCRPGAAGLLLVLPKVRRALKTQVAQLERLKTVLEKEQQRAAA
ncbi:SRPBCC family protein [Arthrobacter sp. B3I4]|uniref:SRPBCC family protein n=1 Tax=Arthrobacter sp. B3I4 TaxID=3042267 RepID=UPI0027862EB5|nr:SRPBCC family protein [Arthrobacter sp. B3I4]MDQ0754937.1 putative membrane protein [Arthrobacter sp. B3I4]